jgi:hypothetical protein
MLFVKAGCYSLVSERLALRTSYSSEGLRLDLNIGWKHKEL